MFCKSVTILFMVVCTLVFFSCHDEIFYMIDQEVEQEDGIGGDVNALVRYGDKLYTCNGHLYTRTTQPSSGEGGSGRYNGQWSRVSTSGLDGHIYALAADSTYLYAAVIEFEEDTSDSTLNPSKWILYCSSDGSSFEKVTLPAGSGDEKPKGLFDNQAIESAERKAYAKIGANTTTTEDGTESTTLTYYTYILNGTEAPEQGTKERETSAVLFKGTNYTSSLTMTCNETYIYWAAGGSTLYYGTDIAADPLGSVDLEAGSIYALSCTADYLILGTSSGIKRVKLNTDQDSEEYMKPESSVTKFDNNANSLLTNRVDTVLVLDPTQKADDTDIFATMTIAGYLTSSNNTFKQNGLYAYYPGRGKWNRDGCDE